MTERNEPVKNRSFPPSLPYEDWLIERLNDPVEAAAYLHAVMEEGDQAAMWVALRQVVQARGLEKK